MRPSCSWRSKSRLVGRAVLLVLYVLYTASEQDTVGTCGIQKVRQAAIDVAE